MEANQSTEGTVLTLSNTRQIPGGEKYLAEVSLDKNPKADIRVRVSVMFRDTQEPISEEKIKLRYHTSKNKVEAFNINIINNFENLEIKTIEKSYEIYKVVIADKVSPQVNSGSLTIPFGEM